MITVSYSPFAVFALVAIRLGVILIFTPIQAIRQLPIHVRLFIVFALSIFLVSNLSLSVRPPDEIGLAIDALVELSNGLILSISLFAAFAVFQIAGQLIDTQIGLNSLAILNPVDHSYDPLTGRLLSLFAVLTFFALNGHHRLIQGLAFSLTIIPPGKLIFFNHLSLLLNQFGLVLNLAWMLASPVLIAILLIEFLSAIITRNMPQMSTYFLAMPIKILLGFFLLIFIFNYVTPLADHLFNLCFQTWHEVMV
ncbi:flagellar biosynthetic protein FliR [Legionella micdadei]|uniref:Flagellar biosynthetic protein FliR n=1 Tax=Legionella micdadei TaxID=451 RepID=A0A098GHZ7_LEGMI|nr:flagellar biosynthetic protein FliR [Legionella micdadei]ARG96972.1 hypothetical protein B6N58_04400 [Legionella micdadei]ARH00772.1 hypothetical protein B6V88_10300 [Legionella micdadei]KTD26683.1 flagellar biosynthetic protein fliR [Legionella micdadei]NSL19488.1 flagellar biosynthetic protein FliR [Legionella micdadei]CEG61620.1 putative flagellar biosynthesis pathway, component FliR [Legionella micdadei]